MKRTILLAALGAVIIGFCAAFTVAPVDLFDFATAGFVPLVGATSQVALNSRARGILDVRLDAGDQLQLQTVINELQKTFADFKAERTKEIDDIRKGLADVVQTEKVDRINDEVGRLQTAIDEVNAALRVGGGGGHQDRSPDLVAYDQAFDRFFRRGIENGLQDLAVKAALATDTDPDGGYVVPDQMEAGIDRVLASVSAMRAISRVVQISTGTYKRLVGQGGAGGGWVGERESRPETDSPTLKEIVFNVMELYANPAATQAMLDDGAVNVAQWLADEVSIKFGELEGAAFISGTGVNQPRGILQYDTVADASWTWGNLGFIASGVAADISDSTHNGTDALISLVYALKQGYRTGASFLMNRTLQGAVRKLKTIGDTEAYLWQPSVQAGQPATLLGYPVSDDDNMSAVGSNAFPIAFGNFQRGYLIVDRVGIRVLRDPYTNKPYVHFYTTKRVGGGVQNFEAIKLLKCSA